MDRLVKQIQGQSGNAKDLKVSSPPRNTLAAPLIAVFAQELQEYLRKADGAQPGFFRPLFRCFASVVQSDPHAWQPIHTLCCGGKGRLKQTCCVCALSLSLSRSTRLVAGNFTKSPQDLDRAIQQLDPRLHTMGIIHLLAARAQMPMDDGAVFLEHCLRLFSSGTGEQARLEPKRCVRIVHKLTALATE